MTIKLGQKCRDIVSGFEGIAVARSEYMNGCVQICLHGPVVDGKRTDPEWVDIQRIEVVDDGVLAKASPAPTGGGVRSHPKL